MCTYKITVDENVMEQLKPTLSEEDLGQLLQQYVDDLMERMTIESSSQSPISRTEEEMRAIVKDRIRKMELGAASYIDGKVGFAQIREQYGL